MFDSCNLNFKNCELSVDICDTEQTRSQGLMHIRHMPDNCGMLFVMDRPGPASFWMKDTLIPLDIAFLDKEMRVIKIGQMEPHIGNCECFGPVRYVVETNRGWFDKNGVMLGDKMTMNDEEATLRQVVGEVIEEMWRRPTSFGDIVYRPFSDRFFQTIIEMKQRSHSLQESKAFDAFHREVFATDIGEFDIFEETVVPLDMPIPSKFHEEMFPHLHEADDKIPSNVKLYQPKRGGDAKFYVYVRDPKTKKIKKVGFGAKGMSVGIHDPARIKSFKARHRCETRNDKTKPSYWSCRLPRYWKSLGLKKTTSKWW